MRLLEEDIRKTTPILCEIQRDYIKYMHDADWRVSVKYNNRKFVGLSIIVYAGYKNNNKFLLALLTVWGLTGIKSVFFNVYEDLILLICGLYGVVLLFNEIKLLKQNKS